MQVVEKPKEVVRIRIDAFKEGKNVPGGESIHLTDTTVNEVYLAVSKALGIQDQLRQMKIKSEAAEAITARKMP